MARLVFQVAGLLRLFTTNAIASPTRRRGRLLASAFIAAYLLWQVFVPLTYYVGQDKFDERFAWRMFSALGFAQKKCTVTVTETSMSPKQVSVPPFDLELIIGNFLSLLQRNRAAVLEKFLRSRCKINPKALRVHLVRMCPVEGGSEIPAGEMQINCFTGALKGTFESP